MIAPYTGKEPYLSLLFSPIDEEMADALLRQIAHAYRVWYPSSDIESTGSTALNANHATFGEAVIALVTEHSVADHTFRLTLTRCVRKRRPLVVVSRGKVSMLPGMRLQLEQGTSVPFAMQDMQKAFSAIPGLEKAMSAPGTEETESHPEDATESTTSYRPSVRLTQRMTLLVTDVENGRCAAGDSRLTIGSGIQASLRFIDPALSPEHCCVSARHGRLILQQLSGSRDIAVDGVPMSQNPHTTAESCCELTVGSHHLLAMTGDPAARAYELGEIACLTSEQTGEVRWLLQENLELGRMFAWRSNVLSDTSVSRQHATLARRENVWYLVDHSRHGTLVNGIPCHFAQSPLLDGDRLQLGQSVLIFSILHLKKE